MRSFCRIGSRSIISNDKDGKLSWDEQCRRSVMCQDFFNSLIAVGRHVPLLHAFNI